MEQLRSFVAIELDEPVLKALEKTQAILRGEPAGQYGRWVRSEGIHLTLKFLGDVPASRVDDIVARLEEAVGAFSSFRIAFGNLGCFPNSRLPRVIWVGVQDSSGELGRLQRSVDECLHTLGYPTEKRAFHPHLTLARSRKASKNELSSLGQLVERTKVDRLGEMVVREVSLMRSQLRPSGAVYSQLAAFPLKQSRLKQDSPSL